jgi:hypothetical protein
LCAHNHSKASKLIRTQVNHLSLCLNDHALSVAVEKHLCTKELPGVLASQTVLSPSLHPLAAKVVHDSLALPFLTISIMDPNMPMILPKGIVTNSENIYKEVADFPIVPPDKVWKYWHGKHIVFPHVFSHGSHLLSVHYHI